MMARKLSVASAFVIAGSVFIAPRAFPEGDIQITAPANVVENPFAAPQPRTRVVSAEPQPSQGRPTTYQNPFAKASKAPPIDTSLRLGPVSRWQRPVIPRGEPSVIKAAVLSQPSPTATEPAHLGWDQLPPVEDLLQQAANRVVTDPTSIDRVAVPHQSTLVAPTPLGQPAWIAAHIDIADPLESMSSIRFGKPPIASIHNGQPANSPTADEDAVPNFVSDGEDTPECWLAHAQDAALNAESVEELSTIIALCDRGLHVSPSAKTLSSLRRLCAWAHNRRGEYFADSQRPEDAIKDFQDAISMDPNCALAIHNRAVTFAQRNQYAAALRDFNRVIELNPGLAVAYRNRAELLAALGRMDEAVVDYDQAISALPEDAALLQARAYAYQRLGDFAHAAADINRAIQLAPRDPDALTQRGNLSAEQGNFEQAQEDFRRAIASDSNWADAHRSLAWLYATCPDRRFRNAELALPSAHRAAQLASPDDYQVLDTLAAAYACGGQFDEAVKLQQKALVAAPRVFSTPLEERLKLYQRDQAFSSAPVAGKVRTVSHETTAPSPSPRPTPASRNMPR
jgi:tetratricopeptide (TPR) repeat protein